MYLLDLTSPRSAASQCLGLFPQSGIKVNVKCSVWPECGEEKGETLLSFMMTTSGGEDNESIVFLAKNKTKNSQHSQVAATFLVPALGGRGK